MGFLINRIIRLDSRNHLFSLKKAVERSVQITRQIEKKKKIYIYIYFKKIFFRFGNPSAKL